MEKLAEIKALKALMNDDTYLKDSISIESFEEMVLNIQNDHPIFLNTPHDGERQASLIKKVEELEAMLKEKNETIEALENQVTKYSDKADRLLEDYEAVAKKLVILTRVTSKALDPDKIEPQLRIELKAAYGTLPLADDELEKQVEWHPFDINNINTYPPRADMYLTLSIPERTEYRGIDDEETYNVLWFELYSEEYWHKRNVTHWAYIPAPPQENALNQKEDKCSER